MKNINDEYPIAMNSVPANKTGVKPFVPARVKVRMAVTLHDEGLSTREIAATMGMTRSGICKLLSRAGYPFGKQGGTSRVGAYIPRHLKANVRRQAEAKGVSVSSYIAAVLGAVCIDDATAKKTLGRHALPVRAYRGSIANG